MRVWRLSNVCLSVAYIVPKSITERSRKTKIDTEVAHVTVTRLPLWKSKGQRSTCKVRWHIMAASRTVCYCCYWCQSLTVLSGYDRCCINHSHARSSLLSLYLVLVTIFFDFSATDAGWSKYNKLCGRPPHYAPFDFLTLKVVSESRVMGNTSMSILVFRGLSVLDLGPMYATDVRQTSYRQTSDVRQTSHSINA